MTRLRISKNGEFSKLYPTVVADRIRAIAQDRSVSSITPKTVPSDYQFYIGEGHSNTGIASDGTTATFEAVSDHNIGASNVTHRIGQKFSMPSGTYLIQTGYYSGYWIDVYTIGPAAIEA